MKTITAGEIMIPLDKYPHIPYWFSIREAVAIIHHSELDIQNRKSLARAVLVFDKEYKLLGLVRRRDILKGLDPENLLVTKSDNSTKLFDVNIDPNLLELSTDRLINTIKENAETPVSQIMQPINCTVNYDDHILKIIYEIDLSGTSMIPVMKDDIVVGVVRTVEVLNELVSILDV